MPGQRHHIRDSEDHPDPIIIQREPKFYNPFSRRRRDTVIVTERSTRRRHRPREERSPDRDITLIPQRGRNASSPPPPPIIRQGSVRIVSPSSIPIHRRNVRIPRSSSPTAPHIMSPTPGQKGFVPLPPKIPTEEEQARAREHISGRHSSQSHGGEIQIVEEGIARRRSPRPYHRRQQTSDPYREQEEFIETPARRTPESEHYEVIQPNEPIRSRQRNNDVRRSREYRDMEELAKRNLKAAQEATQRCSNAEMRLQTMQKQLAASEIRESTLQRELDKTRKELEDCRLDRKYENRERDLRERSARLDRNEHEFENNRLADREQERPRASRHPVTVHQQPPANYITRAPDEEDAAIYASINQAHVDAKANKRGRG